MYVALCEVAQCLAMEQHPAGGQVYHLDALDRKLIRLLQQDG